MTVQTDIVTSLTQSLSSTNIVNMCSDETTTGEERYEVHPSGSNGNKQC